MSIHISKFCSSVFSHIRTEYGEILFSRSGSCKGEVFKIMCSFSFTCIFYHKRFFKKSKTYWRGKFHFIVIVNYCPRVFLLTQQKPIRMTVDRKVIFLLPIQVLLYYLTHVLLIMSRFMLIYNTKISFSKIFCTKIHFSIRPVSL